MTEIQHRLLKQFNNKLLSFVNQMIVFAPPDIKEIKILPTTLEFAINHGNPTIIINLFYENLSLYASRIYQDTPDRSLLEGDFIFNQLSGALNRNKDRLDNDKFEVFTNVLQKDENKIKDHICYTRNKWDEAGNNVQIKMWKDMQILLKLSEKYVQLTN